MTEVKIELPWVGVVAVTAFRSPLPRCCLPSAWVLVWTHAIHIEDLSHNDHQLVAKMLVSLAAREKPSNIRSLKTKDNWLKDWKLIDPEATTETPSGICFKNRQGCLVAEGGWHLRRLPDGHPTKLGECSTRPGYLQIALRHSAKHRLGIASEVHVSTLQLVGVDSLQFWNGTDVKSLKYQ